MKGIHFSLQFGVLAMGALTLGAVLAAGFDRAEVSNGSKGVTETHKGPLKVDKQSPAVQKVAPKGSVPEKALKGGDASPKQ